MTKNWFEAFDNLKAVIKSSNADRKVVFIDEVPWMGRSDAQIDLLIDRRDGIINICEMKYWAGPYLMTADDDASLMNKKLELKTGTKTRKAVHLMMVTSFGVRQNAYSGKVQSFVMLDDLFA